MLCNNIKNIASKRRTVIITSYDPEGKYINRDLLKVGYREDAKPYSGEMLDDPSQRMNPKNIDTYLYKIEAAHRGFRHSNNTYYGCDQCETKNNWNKIPEPIQYDSEISQDPTKLMDLKYKEEWLNQIHLAQCEYKKNNNE